MHLLVNKKDFAGIKMHGTTIQINHSPLSWTEVKNEYSCTARCALATKLLRRHNSCCDHARTATEQLLVLATFFISVQNGLHRDSTCVCCSA